MENNNDFFLRKTEELQEEDEEDVTELLRKKTFEFFKANGIVLDTKVDNALCDVFDENDFNPTAKDESINIYFKEDIEDFLNDTAIITQINTQVTGGNSSGLVLEKFDYYDQNLLRTSGAETHNYGLYDGESLVKQLLLIEPKNTNIIDNPVDWCICVIEETEFNHGQVTVTPRAYIYCPLSGEGI